MGTAAVSGHSGTDKICNSHPITAYTFVARILTQHFTIVSYHALFNIRRHFVSTYFLTTKSYRYTCLLTMVAHINLYISTA